MRASQLDLLGEVEAGNVGFRQAPTGDGRYGFTNSYRLWSSEYDYKVVTGRVRTLLNLGLVEIVHNQSMFGRGAVELSATGRGVLDEAFPTRTSYPRVSDDGSSE